MDISHDLLGVFPLGNAIPYTRRWERLGPDNTPLFSTWYHGTWESRVGDIARYGLVPSCWLEGFPCSNCCVFGFDNIDNKYGDWVIQIYSRVEKACQAKAWWVPPQNILGAWHEGKFHGRHELVNYPKSEFTIRCCQNPNCDFTRIMYNQWHKTIFNTSIAV
jgi:hypothetical protein